MHRTDDIPSLDFVGYTILLGKDCLWGHDFHVIRAANFAQNYKLCQDYCDKDRRCGAVVVNRGTCYFKPHSFRGLTCSRTFKNDRYCTTFLKHTSPRKTETNSKGKKENRILDISQTINV